MDERTFFPPANKSEEIVWRVVVIAHNKKSAPVIRRARCVCSLPSYVVIANDRVGIRNDIRSPVRNTFRFGIFYHLIKRLRLAISVERQTRRLCGFSPTQSWWHVGFQREMWMKLKLRSANRPLVDVFNSARIYRVNSCDPPLHYRLTCILPNEYFIRFHRPTGIPPDPDISFMIRFRPTLGPITLVFAISNISQNFNLTGYRMEINHDSREWVPRLNSSRACTAYSDNLYEQLYRVMCQHEKLCLILWTRRDLYK